MSAGRGVGAVAALGLLGVGLAASALTQTLSGAQGGPKKEVVMIAAQGTFDVKLLPQPPDDPAAGEAIGRMSIDKQFHGDLEGTSKGQMLAVMTDVKGSAGYVAMERVTGKLQGKTGTFSLQHNGIMTRGEPELTVTVVPDSGTGELKGLAGRMTINIAEGKHSYVFEYALAPTP